MESKTALVTGVTGQDGAYLSKHLLEQGYEVYGAMRRSASGGAWRLDQLGITDDIHPVELELTEPTNVLRAIRGVNPDEVYNLAAQSFVGSSFATPAYTAQVDALGVTHLLEALREYAPRARFYQASTSEMFGKVQETPQRESTPFYPRSPYGVAKLYGHWLTINYRESYGMHTTSGILFNHESELRGAEFVTRKITTSLARIKHGLQEKLELGNLAAQRDWGYAPEYVEAMRLMLQQEEGGSYVVATGQTTSVEAFVDAAASTIGIDLEWAGRGESRTASWDGREVVSVNPEFYRPAEVEILLGDATKARDVLGWSASVAGEKLAAIMALADEAIVSNARVLA